MASIKGPAIFLAQFVRGEAPLDDVRTIGEWVATVVSW
jgi:hypothetical protein